jgi:hypothetical protein
MDAAEAAAEIPAVFSCTPADAALNLGQLTFLTTCRSRSARPAASEPEAMTSAESLCGSVYPRKKNKFFICV